MAVGKRIKVEILTVGVPLIIAVVSFVLSIHNWNAQRARDWEVQRPLATTEVRATVVHIDELSQIAHFFLQIDNVGELTFVIRDIHIKMETSGDLTAEWRASSLVQQGQVPMPLGLKQFALYADAESKAATYRFDGSGLSWHIIDPRRTVEIPFLVPIQGKGIISIATIVFLQPIHLNSVNDDITVMETVNGKPYPIVPESGSDSGTGNDSISDLPIYPYSNGQQLIVALGS